jgi:hypothetical protein
VTSLTDVDLDLNGFSTVGFVQSPSVYLDIGTLLTPRRRYHDYFPPEMRRR